MTIIWRVALYGHIQSSTSSSSLQHIDRETELVGLASDTASRTITALFSAADVFLLNKLSPQQLERHQAFHKKIVTGQPRRLGSQFLDLPPRRGT